MSGARPFGEELVERLRGLLRRGGRPPANSETTAAPAAPAPPRAAPRVHLPTRIRWGTSSAVKRAADGSPYLTVPLDGGQSFRVMRPDSPGWWVPVHRFEAAGKDRALTPAHPWTPAAPAAAPSAQSPARASPRRPRRGLGWLLRFLGA